MSGGGGTQTPAAGARAQNGEAHRADVWAPGEVCDISLPPDATALTTLSRVDYTDAFLLSLPKVGERTAEEWAREALEGASAPTRAGLRRGWFLLGVRLGSTDDPRRVLGWEVRRSSSDVALLGAHSVFGMEAEILIRRESGALLAATIMKLNNPIVRGFWAPFSLQHQRVLRALLAGCGRRAV